MAERRWTEDEKLCFSYKHPTERDGVLYECPIDSITDVVVDPKIGRVRFSADGTLYICRNLDTRNVEKTWAKPKSIVDVYDYTEPSLIDTLEKYGMAVEYIRM